MPITRRGTSWQAQVNHGGQRFRRSFPTESAARHWQHDAKAALQDGRMPPGIEAPRAVPQMTLGQLYEATDARFWRHAKSATVLSHNGRCVRDIIGPDRPVSAIGEAEIASLIGELRRIGNSDATINRKLAALSKMLTYAHKRLKIISEVPVIDRLKEPEGRLKWWDTQLEGIIHAKFRQLGHDEMVDFCVVAIDTGCRFSEVLRIERDHIHQDASRLDARPVLSIWETKNGHPRSVPLTARAAEVLRRRTAEDPRAFHLDASRVRYLWDRTRSLLDPETAEAMGTPHTLRHTFCSRLVQRGIDIRSVQQLAGHASLGVTMRYAHLCPRTLETAIASLENSAIAR